MYMNTGIFYVLIQTRVHIHNHIEIYVLIYFCSIQNDCKLSDIIVLTIRIASRRITWHTLIQLASKYYFSCCQVCNIYNQQLIIV